MSESLTECPLCWIGTHTGNPDGNPHNSAYANPDVTNPEENDVERAKILFQKIMLFMTTKEITAFLNLIAEFNTLSIKIAREEELERLMLVYRKV